MGTSQSKPCQGVIDRLWVDHVGDLVSGAIVRNGDHGTHLGAQAFGPGQLARGHLALELDQNRQLHHARRRKRVAGVEVELFAAHQIRRGDADVNVGTGNLRCLGGYALQQRAGGRR